MPAIAARYARGGRTRVVCRFPPESEKSKPRPRSSTRQKSAPMRGTAAGMSGRTETLYARPADLAIASQVAGSGPLELVFVPGFISYVEFRHARLSGLRRASAPGGDDRGADGDRVVPGAPRSARRSAEPRPARSPPWPPGVRSGLDDRAAGAASGPTDLGRVPSTVTASKVTSTAVLRTMPVPPRLPLKVDRSKRRSPPLIRPTTPLWALPSHTTSLSVRSPTTVVRLIPSASGDFSVNPSMVMLPGKLATGN
jgi:hypothetical protein